MRIMTKGDQRLEVIEHIITQNGWEFYVTSEEDEDRLVDALTVGFETEFGAVSLEEIEPFIIYRSERLEKIRPASGWQWEEEEI